MVRRYGLSIFSLLIFLFSGCAETQEVSHSRAAKGAAIGAAAGAVTGAIVGKGKGAVIGGLTGAAVGGGIGYMLDKQAKELEQIPNTEVKREEDRLVVTMSDAVLFDLNSAALKETSKQTLGQMADIMNRYPENDILVKGHTDSTGSEKYNQELSERRAKSVKNYLIDKGVFPQRITAIGFGETMPVAPNETSDGRQKNRRVEIEIKPKPQAGS